jgi:hypothetical protein
VQRVRRACLGVSRIMTKRSVPVKEQLRSHQLFARNFDCYVRLVDAVTLYDNSRHHSESGQVGEPNVIATKEEMGEELRIVDDRLYKRFREVASLNINAARAQELYISASVTHSGAGSSSSSRREQAGCNA